jgi:hypothetical protein
MTQMNALHYHVVAENCADSHFKTLAYIVQNGALIPGSQPPSIRSGQDYTEVINFSLLVLNPGDHVVVTPSYRLNLVTAVARFIWMMSGSDLLSAIAFYEPTVAEFSDDGITIPGSSFGRRIFNPRSGINQLEGILARLRNDPNGRRAAVAVYQAEDSCRESRDIPCLFGLFFHLRDSRLSTTVIMRANNAYRLFPYNLFELSLLAEVISTELDVPLGPLNYSVVSMHIYAPEYQAATSLLAHRGNPVLQPSMAAMPPSPLEQIRKLVLLEADLRNQPQAVDRETVEGMMQKAHRDLDPYWRNFYYVLLQFVARGNGEREAAATVIEAISEPWRTHLQAAN